MIFKTEVSPYGMKSATPPTHSRCDHRDVTRHGRVRWHNADTVCSMIVPWETSTDNHPTRGLLDTSVNVFLVPWSLNEFFSVSFPF